MREGMDSRELNGKLRVIREFFESLGNEFPKMMEKWEKELS